MAATTRPGRRRFLGAAAALALGGCQPLSEKKWVHDILAAGEWVSLHVQRALSSRDALATEFTEADISPTFRVNGTHNPADTGYQALARRGFAGWQLIVDGLVARPARLTLEELRAMPSRTQITRHDCVEGWSCIGKWTGVRLSTLLERAGLRDEARYIVFHCIDRLDPYGPRYYESVDLVDALHPQTILAYEMNDGPLSVGHGAPLRLRVERQLGYKMAKYVMRIEAVASYAHIGRGKGGYWEDLGYAWYAGI